MADAAPNGTAPKSTDSLGSLEEELARIEAEAEERRRSATEKHLAPVRKERDDVLTQLDELQKRLAQLDKQLGLVQGRGRGTGARRGKRVSREEAASQVLAVVQGAGAEGLNATAIEAKVDASINTVRGVLEDLQGAGKIERQGERANTRYIAAAGKTQKA